MATANPTNTTLTPARKSQPFAAAVGAKDNPASEEATPTLKTSIPKCGNAPSEVLDGPVVAPIVNTQLEPSEEKASPVRKGASRIRPLSKQEVDDLEIYEGVINEGLPKFLAVGEALYLIREKKLYRMQYKTFAEYCEKRFGLSRQNAYLQIAAAEVTENLSSNGLQIPAGTTERVLRPLANQTAEVQVEAWKLAQTKAAGKKLSGKDIEDALKEVLGEAAQQKIDEDWYTRCRNRFLAAGYKTDFEQPVSLGEDEWIDFLDGEEGVFIKIVDQPTLSGLGICVAMRESDLKYRVIVNGNSVRKADLALAKDGTLTHLLEPGMSYFIHLLGACVERDGRLYEPDLFERGYRLKLKRASSDDPTERPAATEAEKPAVTAEE